MRRCVRRGAVHLSSQTHQDSLPPESTVLGRLYHPNKSSNPSTRLVQNVSESKKHDYSSSQWITEANDNHTLLLLLK
jgi:hypothetical protein